MRSNANRKVFRSSSYHGEKATFFFELARSSALIAALCIGTFSTVFGQEQDAQITEPAPKSYVLTRLGAICEGRLSEREDAYLLEFEGGGSTMVSKLDALYIGSTRESIYQYKASQTHMEDVNEVLRLADWASRRQLGSEAIKTLREKLSTSHDQAERRALSRKLEELEQAESFRKEVAKGYAPREKSSSSTRQESKRKIREPLSPEDAELEEWGAPIPAPSLERFSRKAQPILQKRCSSASCHGPGSETRYLLRGKTLGTGARLALLYNLRSTLEYVDFENIGESALLNHPPVVNAKDERVYPFGNDRSSLKDCQTFMSWVESLKTEQVLTRHAQETRRENSGPKLRAGAASRYDVEPAEGGTSGQSSGVSATDGASAQVDASGVDFSSLVGTAEPSNEEDAPRSTVGRLGFGTSSEASRYMTQPEDDPNSSEARLQRVGLRPTKKYRDAYDPAIFNDRYHPKN